MIKLIAFSLMWTLLFSCGGAMMVGFYYGLFSDSLHFPGGAINKDAVITMLEKMMYFSFLTGVVGAGLAMCNKLPGTVRK